MATDRKVAVYPSGAAVPSGYAATYTSLSTMEAAENGDLTAGGGTRLLVEIVPSDGTWSGAPDTTRITWDGWTCNYANGEYIWVYTVGDAKPDYAGGWDTTAYILAGTGTAISHLFTLDNDHAAVDISLVLEDIQFQKTGNAHTIEHAGGSYIGTVHYKRCWLWDDTYAYNVNVKVGINISDEIMFQNCIFDGAVTYHGYFEAGPVYVVNCTSAYGFTGFQQGTADGYIINSALMYGTTNELGYGTPPSGYPLNCASDVGAGTGTDGIDLTPGVQATDLHVTFTDPDDRDYTLTGVTTTADLLSTGVTNAVDSHVPLTDILGNERPALTPGAGAYYYGTTPPTPPTPGGGGGMMDDILQPIVVDIVGDI